jgi:hypothetical protein
VKRDMDLIRLLLLQIEGEESLDLSDYTKKEVRYHRRLLIEAGLAYGSVMEDGSGEPAAVVTTRLSWEGHEFLDAARNQSLWDKTKEIISKVNVSVTFPIVKEILTILLKEQLGIK